MSEKRDPVQVVVTMRVVATVRPVSDRDIYGIEASRAVPIAFFDALVDKIEETGEQYNLLAASFLNMDARTIEHQAEHARALEKHEAFFNEHVDMFPGWEEEYDEENGTERAH